MKMRSNKKNTECIKLINRNPQILPILFDHFLSTLILNTKF